MKDFKRVTARIRLLVLAALVAGGAGVHAADVPPPPDAAPAAKSEAGLAPQDSPAAASEPAADNKPAPLPNPLTLEEALKLADAANPRTDIARAAVDQARAGARAARAISGVQAYMDLTAVSVDPAAEPGQNMTGDSVASLVLRKPLYDFGRSHAQRAAADAALAGKELLFADAKAQYRIRVMQDFFAVILADLKYAVDNEELAQRYVRFDKARDRHELGEVSLVDLKGLESNYRDIYVTRTRSEKRQASTRAQLAIDLGRPDNLPEDLQPPQLPGNRRAAPDFQAMLKLALKQNPVLAALRQQVASAQAAVDAQRARRRPVISAEVEANQWEREFGSRDDLRAGLNLRIPIYQGGQIGADIAKAQARLQDSQARLTLAEQDMRRTVLELVQRLESLKVARDAAKVRADYRDLYLDRARGQYELEIQTTLGDAMTRLSEAQYQTAQADFETAVTWAKLEAVVGQPLGKKTKQEKAQ
jgi:outer membrane protein TolC